MTAPIKLKKTSNFNFRECLWFLDRGLDDCMHTATETSVVKLLRIEKKPILIEVSETSTFLNIEILKGSVKNQQLLKNYVEEWMDLSRDIAPFYKLLRKDREFSVLAKKFRGTQNHWDPRYV